MAPETYQRKLTAILSADVEGYSRLMGDDEDTTIRTLTTYRELMSTLIDKHRGKVVDSPGDNVLAEFSSVVDAVRCAVEIQEELRIRNAELPENRRMEFRIGINLGDVVEEADRIYGDGINIAARVEGLADGGGICISGPVYDSIKNKLSLSYEPMGEHTVKNIKEPVRVYRMRIGPDADASMPEGKIGLRHWPKTAVAAVAVLVVAAGAWAIWNYYFRLPSVEPASIEKMAYTLPEQPSIAVLPFANMSEDPNQDYFSDGITEEIITALSKTPKIFVIARNSTFTYKDKPVKIQQVAEELGVRYVLEGSVRKADDNVRITAQLIDAITGKHMWAERYDRKLEDIFSVQDEITKNIITELQVKLTEGEHARIYAKGTDNLEAYLKVMRVYSIIGGGKPENNVQARQLAEEAIALDPNWPVGYCALASAHTFDVWYGMSKNRDHSLEQAFELAQKALALDEKLGAAHYRLAIVYTLKKQFEKSIEHGKLAVELEPNSANYKGSLARLLMNAGKPEESIPLYKNALRLDPYTRGNNYYNYGYALWMVGKYKEAIKAGKEALSRSPNDIFTHIILAISYMELGQTEDAEASGSEVIRIKPNFTLEWLAKIAPWKNKDDVNRMVDKLRKAGLPEKSPLPLPDKPSIAVLAFENMSGDPEQDYFSDGLSEEIITALSKTPKLFVTARNSSFAYKGKPVKIQQVGRDLGVKYVLEGSVRKAGNRIRITAQLVDAVTGHHLWAERYDRELRDIFSLQDEITMKILNALEVRLTDGEQALIQKKGTKNLKAYLKLLQGIHYSHVVNPENVLKARQIFEEIITEEPDYAIAYSQIARTYWIEVLLGTSKSPKESLRKAADQANKSLSIDQSLGASYAYLGHINIMRRNWEKGILLLNQAVELEPNGAESHYLMGLGLSFSGRPEEAMPIIKKAIRLNPITPAPYFNVMAIAYRMVGQLDKAIEFLEKGIQRHPNILFSHLNLSACYILAGREQEAHKEAKEVLRLNPKFSLDRFNKALPLKDQEEKKRFIGALRKAFSFKNDS